MKVRHSKEIDLSTIKGWSSLKENEQLLVRNETQALTEAIFLAGKTKLAIGEHLSKIHRILQPKRMWEPYLQLEGLQQYRISRATAHRYMHNFEVAKTILPKPVLKVAMMRGMDSLSAKVVTLFPPPKSHKPKVIHQYLDKIEKRQPRGGDYADNKDMLKACFRFLQSQLNRVKPNERIPVVRELVGMLMTLTGMSASTTFHPKDIPMEFIPLPKGRPKTRPTAA